MHEKQSSYNPNRRNNRVMNVAVIGTLAAVALGIGAKEFNAYTGHIEAEEIVSVPAGQGLEAAILQAGFPIPDNLTDEAQKVTNETGITHPEAGTSFIVEEIKHPFNNITLEYRLVPKSSENINPATASVPTLQAPDTH